MSNPGSTPTLDDVAREFPAWEITVTPAAHSPELGTMPAGMIVAYRQSADGRHRRVITARTPAELLDALRGI